MGPELLRVKDLARRSNNFTIEDYNQALDVLNCIKDRKTLGVIYRKEGASKENVPANTRLGGGLDDSMKEELFRAYNTSYDKYEAAVAMQSFLAGQYSIGDRTEFNEFKESDLYKLDSIVDDAELDIAKNMAPTNKRFTIVAYSALTLQRTWHRRISDLQWWYTQMHLLRWVN
jgi:hypothetical protein